MQTNDEEAKSEEDNEESANLDVTNAAAVGTDEGATHDTTETEEDEDAEKDAGEEETHGVFPF